MVTTRQGEFTSTTKTTATALLVAKTNTSVREGVRKVFLSILIQSFANDAVEILIASWRKLYSTTLYT